MSMFENSEYRWRETYFVLFDAPNRPLAEKVEQTLAALDDSYELKNVNADEAGRLDSLTLISPDDSAALDICFIEGTEVTEQAETLASDVAAAAADTGEEAPVNLIRRYEARLDVLHFEHVSAPISEDDPDLEKSDF